MIKRKVTYSFADDHGVGQVNDTALIRVNRDDLDKVENSLNDQEIPYIAHPTGKAAYAVDIAEKALLENLDGMRDTYPNGSLNTQLIKGTDLGIARRLDMATVTYKALDSFEKTYGPSIRDAANMYIAQNFTVEDAEFLNKSFEAACASREAIHEDDSLDKLPVCDNRIIQRRVFSEPKFNVADCNLCHKDEDVDE